jgi:hypothetical protein
MTQRLDRLPFLISGAVAAAVAFGMLSGCTTATIEDVVPTASNQQSKSTSSPQVGQATVTNAAAKAEANAQPTGPVDTGTYPNLNIKPQVAGDQITADEKAAATDSLRAAQKEHVAEAATAGKDTTNPALLRKLAKTHADDTLKEISGQ